MASPPPPEHPKCQNCGPFPRDQRKLNSTDLYCRDCGAIPATTYGTRQRTPARPPAAHGGTGSGDGCGDSYSLNLTRANVSSAAAAAERAAVPILLTSRTSTEEPPARSATVTRDRSFRRSTIDAVSLGVSQATERTVEQFAAVTSVIPSAWSASPTPQAQVFEYSPESRHQASRWPS